MTLTFTRLPFQAADLGTPSIVPAMYGSCSPIGCEPVTLAPGMRPEEGACVDRGLIHTILPYTLQNGYDRELRTREMDCAVLENDFLRATFVLDLGGRLWSLYDKKENRELLYENPVFQPANLALRDAWFSGGVEWNIGMIGHHPYTCSPLFAAEGKTVSGNPLLVLYEYERKRGCAYTIEATLSDALLLLRVTIENRRPTPTWMYWWSNMAIDEKEGNRVIVPARQSYTYTPDGKGGVLVGAEDIPYIGDWDISYPSNHSVARDFFFRVDPEQKKWIASIDQNGKGMAQLSTEREIGRKLFVWGAQSQGGKTWNRWLSHSESRYTEIQAGLLRSQREQCLMPAASEYQWIEGYRSYAGDPAVLHGIDYARAQQTVETALEDSFSHLDAHAFELDGELTIRHYGSGWGALEEKLRGERLSRLVRFPEDSITEESDIAALLESGHLPARDPAIRSLPYVAGEGYIARLEASGDTDWYTQLLLGCAYYEARRFADAKAAFTRSAQASLNPIACRCLAWMCADNGETAQARDWMQRCCALGKDYCRLIVDAAEFYQRFGSDADVCRLIETYGAPFSDGRLTMYYARSLVRLGRLDEARPLVNAHLTVATMREGERSTFTLWCDLYRAIIARDEHRRAEDISDAELLEKYPIPAEIDFRMN